MIQTRQQLRTRIFCWGTPFCMEFFNHLVRLRQVRMLGSAPSLLRGKAHDQRFAVASDWLPLPASCSCVARCVRIGAGRGVGGAGEARNPERRHTQRYQAIRSASGTFRSGQRGFESRLAAKRQEAGGYPHCRFAAEPCQTVIAHGQIVISPARFSSQKTGMSEQPFGGSSVRGTQERDRPAPSALTEAKVCP